MTLCLILLTAAFAQAPPDDLVPESPAASTLPAEPAGEAQPAAPDITEDGPTTDTPATEEPAPISLQPTVEHDPEPPDELGPESEDETEPAATIEEPAATIEEPAATIEEPAATVEDSKPDGAFDLELQRAKDAYFTGDHLTALDTLRALQVRLLMGEEPANDLSAEAMIYLGEIHFKLGQNAEAQAAFRWLLVRDPEYPISPYHHPIEVVGLFELTRRGVQAEQTTTEEPPPPPPPIPALPPSGYLPLGIAQFSADRTAAGIAIGSTQAALGAVSIGYFIHLNTMNRKSNPLGWNEDQIGERVPRRRYSLQWPATIGFYGVWVVSWADAQRAWRKSHRESRGASFIPLAGDKPGATVVVRL